MKTELDLNEFAISENVGEKSSKHDEDIHAVGETTSTLVKETEHMFENLERIQEAIDA